MEPPADTPGPEVSVVIPAWDVPDLLDEALTSVLEQIDAANVVVVDNASAKVLPRSAGVRHVRLGQRVTVGEARNAGLEAVRTPYVVFLDADDLMLPGSVGYLSASIAREGVVAFAGAIIGWRPSTGHVEPWGFPPLVAHRLQHRPYLFASANVFRNLLPVVGAAILDTQAVRRAGGFSPSNRGEDWGLGAVLAFSGPVGLSRRPVLVCRVREDSLSSVSEDVGAILATRRTVRRRVIHDRSVPMPGRLVARLAAPAHWVEARRRARHRHASFGQGAANHPSRGGPGPDGLDDSAPVRSGGP